MPTTPRTQKIITLFQKYLKTKDESLIANLSLDELEDADTDLGWRDRDSSWRIAIQKRIDKLKLENQNTEEKSEQEKQDKEANKRHWQVIWISALIAIIIAFIGWLLGG
ncbi:TPA: hypothetical protein JBD73_08200 [Legionella pneumophila subsp. pneumophila]|nr:hypothetical protein [Legionella pneumophila subsp. pneumophila]